MVVTPSSTALSLLQRKDSRVQPVTQLLSAPNEIPEMNRPGSGSRKSLIEQRHVRAASDPKTQLEKIRQQVTWIFLIDIPV